ncbi:unnamed protein product [Lymnaea stagnalis]|uniref:Uncharacterized protein n=1 Tax=Lymnaea stagnalis TaxID=6523 RepID=A0AAV2HAV9_LYMST
MSRILRQMDKAIVIFIFLCSLELCSGQLVPTVFNTTGIDKYYARFPKSPLPCPGLDPNQRIPIIRPEYCKPSIIWPVAPCCDESTNFRCKQDVLSCPSDFWGPYPYKCRILRNDFLDFRPPRYVVCRCNACLYAGPNHNCCPLVVGTCTPTNYREFNVAAVCVNVTNPIDSVCKIFTWYLPTACSCVVPRSPIPVNGTDINSPTGTS